MRRFSRFQLILIVAIVALLAVDVFLAIGYFQAVNKRADLENDIADKENAIAAMEVLYNIDALTRQLAEAERKLAEEAPFPKEIDPLELMDHIINAMQEARIDSYTYKPSGGRTERIGESTYTGVTYAITTGEQLSRLIKLLNLIEELPYDTLKTSDITLSSAGETWDLKFNVVILIQ